MVNKVIEEASGKVMEKWGKEVAVECQISSAWFQAELCGCGADVWQTGEKLWSQACFGLCASQ